MLTLYLEVLFLFFNQHCRVRNLGMLPAGATALPSIRKRCQRMMGQLKVFFFENYLEYNIELRFTFECVRPVKLGLKRRWFLIFESKDFSCTHPETCSHNQAELFNKLVFAIILLLLHFLFLS